jgi:hypothetical protein
VIRVAITAGPGIDGRQRVKARQHCFIRSKNQDIPIFRLAVVYLPTQFSPSSENIKKTKDFSEGRKNERNKYFYF